ncbi:diacylglycerol/lipid kinase family protein [Tsuneonella amylolytica]|uniref:diacylglycerol/lipid kinase family protein n=1 Tax=Tsuneonella amylolytica TaxID=2338327 RepID=UPI000EA9589C|nr:acylglycerol kinase family protein [Tsuneonella amylolytica]
MSTVFKVPAARAQAPGAPTGAGETASGPAPRVEGGPRIGVIYNPRSHRNRKLQQEVEALPGVSVAAPERRGELRGVLEGFAADGVTCIVVSGGDGTVRDVLTAGLPVFGDAWPALAVIPAGKTNALNADLGAPKDWTLKGILGALEAGNRAVRRPLIVRDRDGGGELAGFIFGAGVFTTAVAAGQDAHRLGAFDSLAVGATAVWGMVQALLGSDRNRWRRGERMAIRTGADRAPLPRSDRGDPARRTFILAMTVEQLPANIRPFADLEGMKLIALDYPTRSLLARAPAIARGWWPAHAERRGLHRCATDRIEIDLGDRFILDGEAFPAGSYEIVPGPALSFVVP